MNSHMLWAAMFSDSEVGLGFSLQWLLFSNLCKEVCVFPDLLLLFNLVIVFLLV